MGGFAHYGIVKEDYLMIKVCMEWQGKGLGKATSAPPSCSGVPSVPQSAHSEGASSTPRSFIGPRPGTVPFADLILGTLIASVLMDHCVVHVA